MKIKCPKCGRQLYETVGHGISQIVIDGVRYCLDCVVKPDPCEGCEFNQKQYDQTNTRPTAQKGIDDMARGQVFSEGVK